LSLITIHVSGCRQFTDIHISQGSVATYLRVVEYLNMSLLQNLSLSQSVKDFSKSVNIWEGYGPELSVLFFGLTVYLYSQAVALAIKL